VTDDDEVLFHFLSKKMAQLSYPYGVFVSNGEVFIADTVRSSPLQELENMDTMAMVNWQPMQN